MYCELCGREISWGYLIEIEGAKVIACADCADRGVIIRKVRAPREDEQRRRKTVEKSEEEPELVLVDDYAERIRAALQEKGLTVEALAKRVNESPHYIERIVDGDLKPTEKLARRLEKLLGITLFEAISEEDELPVSEDEGEDTGEITLGDVVKIRVVKKR